jgi:hypothetical protein
LAIGPDALVRSASAGIPSALVSREGWRRLRGAASRLPRDLSPRSLLLECRLDRRNSLADLSYQVAADSPCLQPLPPGTIERLAMGWLELDSGTDPCLAPSRFFTPAYTLDPVRASELCRSDALALLGVLAAGLGGGALAPAAFDGAERAVRNLPEGCKVRQVGLMESRRPAGLRLCLSGFATVPRHTLLDFLAATGHGTVAADLANSRDGLVAASDYLDLAIDVPAAAGERSGWEAQLARRNPAAEPRWARLLEYLDGCSRLRPEKARALGRVYGSLRMAAREATAPDAVAQFLVFSVNHLKVVFDGRRGPSVKAYLAVVPYQKVLTDDMP